MPLSFRKVHPDAILPTRKHQYDAGIDFYSVEDERIAPWSQLVVDTGIELVEMPIPGRAVAIRHNGVDDVMYYPFGEGWRSVLQIWPKSGLDAIRAIHTGAGVVDYLYRGRVLILLKNQSDVIFMVQKGDPIAQGVIVPCYVGEVTEATESNETERGATGGIVSNTN